MKFYLWLITVLISSFQLTKAQEVRGVLLDSTTKKSIPYGTITIGGQYTIANDQGQFNISPKPYNLNDSIHIQVMGYKDFKMPLKVIKDSILLAPNPILLNEVIVLNNQYIPEELVEEVAQSFDKNYNKRLEKKRIFLRESTRDSIEDFEMDLIKSTYEEIDESLIDELKDNLPTTSNFFVETLFDFYGLARESKNKIEVIKGSVLRDEDNTVDTDIIERKMGNLLENKTSLGSYFKLKSGIFSTKLETDRFSLDTEKDSVTPPKKTTKQLQKERKSYARNRARKIEELNSQLFYSEDALIDVFDKPRRYMFEIVDLKLRGEDYIYTLSFSPKRKSGYTGTMMINARDAAVEMISYKNTDDLRSFSLFGFKFKDHIASGTQLFKKNEEGTYDLIFSELNKGTLAAIERPLKLIEKRKTGSWSRKQNEVKFEFKIQLSSIKKTEYMLMNKESISRETYRAFKPTYSVNKVRLKAFDPKFWEGYSILEPNDLLREFKTQ